MAYFFVNKGFDARINGKRRDDVTLTFNSNAFNTIQAAYSAAGINWDAVEEGDLVNKVVLLDNKCEITGSINYPANGMEILADENGKLRGTLKVTADISGGENKSIRFSKFKNVELTNALADDFYGGVESSSKTTDKLTLGGKITVGKNTHVRDIVDYQTVDIWGENTLVNDVTGNGNVVKKNKEDKPVSKQNTVSGSVTVKDSAKVLGDITGYKNVTVEKAAVTGDIKGIANDLDVAAQYDENKVLTGYGITKNYDEKYTSVSVADNVKWDGTAAKGTLTIKKSAKDAGTVKLEKAEVGGEIVNFTNVTLKDNSTAGGVKRFDQIAETVTQNYKTGKDNAVTLTETIKKTQSFNGSVTVKDSVVSCKDDQNQIVPGDITGYNRVTLTNSTAGDISLFAGTGEDVWKTSTVKNVYEAADANVFKSENWAENAAVSKVASEENHKYSSTGSVTVKLDKNFDDKATYAVGDITGYKSVTIAGYLDKKTKEVKQITAGMIFNKVDESESVKDSRKLTVTGEGNEQKSVYEGTLSSKSSQAAAGSLKVSYAKIEGFSGYKSVTLDNVSVTGNGLGLGAAASGSKKEDQKSVFTTAEDGKISAEISSKTITKSAGSFTAKNSNISSIISNIISNYQTVKLTNSSAGVIYNSDSTKEEELVYKWDNYEKYAQDASNSTYEESALVSHKQKENSKSTGSLTIKLDKDLDKESDYMCGMIIGYKNVSISGYNKDGICKEYTVMDIMGGDTVNTSQYKNKLTSETQEFSSVGKATLENVRCISVIDVIAGIGGIDVIAGIAGFANVVLKNTTIMNGGVIGGKGVKVKGDGDKEQEPKTVSQDVVGSLSMENSVVDREVMGFKTVNVKKGFNSVGTYTGTVNSKESVTIAKNAVLAVKNLALNNEDKLTVNGELILQAKDDKAWNSTLSKIDGKGVVYANAETLNKIKGIIANSQVESKNLGNTSEYFQGIAVENTDNSAAQAAVWDEVAGEFGGWLGVNTEEFNLAFQDKEDYIRFTADENGKVTITGSDWGTTKDIVQLVGEDTSRTITNGSCSFDVTKGEEYIIGITRNDANSMSYTIALEAETV